jgi:hypothetical protein
VRIGLILTVDSLVLHTQLIPSQPNQKAGKNSKRGDPAAKKWRASLDAVHSTNRTRWAQWASKVAKYAQSCTNRLVFTIYTVRHPTSQASILCQSFSPQAAFSGNNSFISQALRVPRIGVRTRSPRDTRPRAGPSLASALSPLCNRPTRRSSRGRTRLTGTCSLRRARRLNRACRKCSLRRTCAGRLRRRTRRRCRTTTQKTNNGSIRRLLRKIRIPKTSLTLSRKDRWNPRVLVCEIPDRDSDAAGCLDT